MQSNTPQLALDLIQDAKEKRLTRLDLGKTGLREFPMEVLELEWLEELSLNNRMLDDEKRKWIEAPNNGGDNQLSAIPEGINRLKQLKVLQLGGDYKTRWEISDISFLEKLIGLQSLYLSRNQISDISFLEKLSDLQSLYLSWNQISDISFLEKLSDLQSLYLRSNQISDISFLEKLSGLQSLDLRSNQISDISFLEKLSGLQRLNLSWNQISNISFLEKLSSLQRLDLRSNQISDISFLGKLSSLQRLYLSWNQISNISFLEKLSSLQRLDLNDNQISDISFLEKLSALQSLYLSNNQISNISFLIPLIKKGQMQVSLEEFDTHRKINLYNNPLETPPLEIVKQGNEAILNYFKALEQNETVELYEAKMLIIGEGRVGKTSLLKKLINEAADLPKEEETTKGIDIQSYNFQTKNNKAFRINIWDFGGQEVYHATHQFFLTKRSLYVLVDDTRKDDKTIHDASFNYWLQTVELFGGESPIVIVQNEKGDRSKALDLKSMQARFNIKDLYATNLLTCRNLAETKTALEFFIQQLPHIGTKLPKQWVEIRNALEDLEQNGTHYLSLNKYFEVCAAHQITEDEQALFLSQYLHDLGVFLHFQEDDILCKTVILSNEWATDAVYKVLDCETVKEAKGRFSRADLKMIWSDDHGKEKYRNMHGELLALMKNFELCYELENKKNTFLAPQLFAEGQPDYTWDDSDNLILRYVYGFMPKGIVSRFIVRMHRYVRDLETAWKHGVVLERGPAKAEVVSFSLYPQQEIRIRVNGVDNRAFLEVITEEFEKIHRLFEGIKVEKLMPCNCDFCKKAHSANKHYFEFEFLKKAYQKNSPVQCQKTLDMIDIHRVVDTLTAQKLRKIKTEMSMMQDHVGSGDNVAGKKEVHNHYYAHAEESEEATLFEHQAKRQAIDKKVLRLLVSENEADEVFEVLLEKAEDEQLKNAIRLLEKRWKINQKHFRKATISDNDFRVEDMRINEALLDWISEW